MRKHSWALAPNGEAGGSLSRSSFGTVGGRRERRSQPELQQLIDPSHWPPSWLVGWLLLYERIWGFYWPLCWLCQAGFVELAKHPPPLSSHTVNLRHSVCQGGQRGARGPRFPHPLSFIPLNNSYVHLLVSVFSQG